MISRIGVDEITPAKYNPRMIADDDFEKLKESVKRLGVIVPIIVNRRNGVIIAGHQRQKACKAVGIKEVPCFFAENVSLTDEVLFNQIHNGTDFDQGLKAVIDPQEATGYTAIPPEQNHAVCEYKAIVKEICVLIERYGNVLSCVATKGGEVFKAPAYADACRTLGIPANCYVIEPENEKYARKAFQGSYGVFTYDHLKKNTWVQGLAQKQRHSGKVTDSGLVSKRSQKSKTYEELVIPNLRKDQRVLDFGAGKGQYAAMLNKRGYNIRTLEFYNNNGSSIIVSKGKRMIEGVIGDVSKDGLYDVVVMDSVLNSVDSMDAERAVMGACSALLKPGGDFYISGRPMSSAEKRHKARHCNSKERCVEFLDANGFSGRYRKGNFYYQKYHSDDMVRDLIAEHEFELVDFKKDSSSWRCRLRKMGESPHQRFGIEFEFSLPYPGGRYDYAEPMKAAILGAGGSLRGN